MLSSRNDEVRIENNIAVESAARKHQLFTVGRIGEVKVES